jgi:hypothetical protein
MAELRAQDAELTLENAPYAGRASCTRRTASCTSCHVSCNTHLHTTQWATAFAVKRSCQLALLGLAERAQHARAMQQCDGRQHTPLSISCNAGMPLCSARCRRSIQTSRRRSRSSLLSAAQVMRRSETVAARSAHSYAHVHAHAPFSHACVSALRECAGCASVSPMWALRVPHAACGGSHARRIPCGVGFPGRDTRRSSPRRVRCRAEWPT